VLYGTGVNGVGYKKIKNALNGTCTIFLVYFMNTVCHICLICIVNRVKMFSASLSINFFVQDVDTL